MARREPDPKLPAQFLGFVLAVYGIGFIGYLGVRRGLPGWYDGLIHPVASPPPWIFGPVWSLLYLLIGAAGWQIWLAPQAPARRAALFLFGLHLILNSLWAWLFFGLQRPYGALFALGVLWVAILLTIVAASRIRPAIAALLVPYLLWVTFAGYLNIGVWSLNYKNHEGVGRIETIVTPS